MKYTKPMLGLLVLVLFTTPVAFALSNPIPGIGIVVKKNRPPAPSRVINTDKEGKFSIQLEEGEIELVIPMDQVQKVVNEILKSANPTGVSQFDGSGIELTLENNSLEVKGKRKNGNTFIIDKQTSSLVVTIPKGGIKLAGTLNWDSSVKVGKAERKGWDGSIKGGSKGIKEGGLK